MKKLLTCLALSLVAASSYAATPLWLRDVQISPDGTEIAFCYKGDIYKVPSNGGTATQLTTQASYECNPIWSRIVNKLPSPVTAMVISTCLSCRWRSSPASYHPFGFRNTVNLHHRRQLYPVLGLHPRPCQQCLVPYLSYDRTIQSPCNRRTYRTGAGYSRRNGLL